MNIAAVVPNSTALIVLPFFSCLLIDFQPPIKPVAAVAKSKNPSRSQLPPSGPE